MIGWIKKIIDKIMPNPAFEMNPVKEKIVAVEDWISTLPGAFHGDTDNCPLKHFFLDDAYMREITMPAGMLIVSKIHKKMHPFFVLKGDVSVLTENGIERLVAPYAGITPAGTKRILFTHEETVWRTVHATKGKTVKAVEKDIILPAFKNNDDQEALEFYARLGLEGRLA